MRKYPGEGTPGYGLLFPQRSQIRRDKCFVEIVAIIMRETLKYVTNAIYHLIKVITVMYVVLIAASITIVRGVLVMSKVEYTAIYAEQ